MREDIISTFEKCVFPFKNKKEEPKEVSEEKLEKGKKKFDRMQKPSWVNISDDNYNSLI